jgi:predicted dehydrogenase
LTTTLDEANQLVQLVERTQLVFAVTYNYTGYPLIRHANSCFAPEKWASYGKCSLSTSRVGWCCLRRTADRSRLPGGPTLRNPEWAERSATSGHTRLHLVEYVTGDPVVELCADKSTFLPGRTLDEDVNALLRFRGGGKGVLTVSQIATGEENGLRVRIYASKGAILWQQENPNYWSCIDMVNRARRSPAAAPSICPLKRAQPPGSRGDIRGISRGVCECLPRRD